MPDALLRLTARIAGWSQPAADQQPGAGGGSQAPVLRRFQMTAYTGGPMVLAGWPHPVVVDLAGMRVSAKARPIFKDHDPRQIVGHTETIAKDNGQITVAGVISGTGPVAQEVVTASLNGFPWQASIGATVGKMVFIPEGRSAEANGRTVAGPVLIARKSTLGEVSFVALGADDDTAASVAAQASSTVIAATRSAPPTPLEIIPMDFDTWITAQGFTLADLTEQQLANLKRLHASGASLAAKDLPDPEDTSAEDGKNLLGVMRAEAARTAAIHRICAKHPEIEAKAVDQGWSADQAELAVLRAERPTAPAIHPSRQDTGEPQVIEAALCLAAGLDHADKRFSAQVLEQADKHYRHMGLQTLLLRAARANGYAHESVRTDMKGMLQAAFSSLSLPGIFSNVANKFLLDGFEAVESTWREIAAIRPVKDFKQVTSYRLTGAFEYEEVGPDGELKHGTVGEESFSNQAKTYGKMFSITRADIINDDLGALTAIPRRLGRGAAQKLNSVFWRTFLGNAALFSAGNKNLLTGADTALTIDGLTKAETAFLDQLDSDGHPLGISPAVLLVPNALLVPATQLMNATEVREDGNSTGRKYPTSNPHAGKFRVVRSSYLADAKLPGASVKAWYLLAEPGDLPVIEVAFLGGQERPTVESAEADFTTLGIQMRGYHDFGVALQDPRAGVKAKGEA